MRLSQLFTKTSKTLPADETARNAQLLIQAGFIYKEMAGVYSFLPLGLKVLNNISDLVKQEMNGIGGQEILMPALQLKEHYEITGRWDDKVVDNWFKTSLNSGAELGLGFTHEEDLTPLIKNFITSYKDLPLAPYQVQTKFRNELRSKSGLMRGREFLMKDMYSYSISQEQHDSFYNNAQAAYTRIYERVGLGDRTFLTFASGGSFSKFSHEFQTLSPAGEDTIYLDRSKKIAVNKEVLSDQTLNDLGLDRGELEEVKSIEVGNIFSLGTKFSEPFGLKVSDDKDQMVTLLMGCYGIGISRLMGTVAEVLSDDKGLIWPAQIAPAKVYLARLGGNESVLKEADQLYQVLTDNGVAVLYDDRDIRPGEKFANADLMGIPYRVVVSDNTIAASVYELKARMSKEIRQLSHQELFKTLGVNDSSLV
jgi:prolyl-tRNA synthetase